MRGTWDILLLFFTRVHSENVFNDVGDDLIEETDFDKTRGAVQVPDRPGLGVTPDMAAVESYRVAKVS